MKKEFQK